MQSLELKQAAYDAAFTAFKRHEAWGWHRLSRFKAGVSAKEKDDIQKGINTYYRLAMELDKAIFALKEEEAEEEAEEEVEAEEAEAEAEAEVEEEAEAEEAEAEARLDVYNYHKCVTTNWMHHNSTFYAALKNFRRFHAKDGLATFQVKKDGACYEDMPLDVKKLLVPGLRLWASILRIPYASKMRRAELVEVLQPTLEALAAGSTRR
jgi:hypothetical protein